MRRAVMIAGLAIIAVAQVGLSANAAPSADGPARAGARANEKFLEIDPIEAKFVQADFATYYSVKVTEAGKGADLKVVWNLDPPRNDPKCKDFQQSSSDRFAAIWKHNTTDGCTHGHKEGARGHRGTVTFTISDGVMECRAKYVGTITGTGDDPTCVNLALTGATLRTQGAVTNELEAVKDIKAGKSPRERITKSIENLEAALTLAAKGGAPSSVRPLIDQAIQMDEAALRLPSAQALIKLSDAIELKEKAVKLLKSATS